MKCRSFLKHVDRKPLTNFGEVSKEQNKCSDACKVDELSVDSNFFLQYLDIFTKSNRIIRFSKGLEYATFSIKKLEYEEFFAKHSFDLSSEFHVSKYELLLFSDSVPDILEQYIIISQTNFVPFPDSITIIFSLQSALFFLYDNDYNVVGENGTKFQLIPKMEHFLRTI